MFNRGFFGKLKSKWAHYSVHRTRDEAWADLFYHIDVFFNRRRLHSARDSPIPAAC